MKRENDCGIPNELTLHNGVTIPCIGNGPGIPYIPYNNENYIVKQLHRVYNKLYARPCLLHHYVEAVSHSFQVGLLILVVKNNSFLSMRLRFIALPIKVPSP